MLPGDLTTAWRSTATFFREHKADSIAIAYEKCAEDLERAVAGQEEELLTLHEAAAETGYSPDHLGRLVRQRKIRNLGRPGAPRVSRKDLPRTKPIAEPPKPTHFSPTQIVRSAINAGD